MYFILKSGLLFKWQQYKTAKLHYTKLYDRVHMTQNYTTKFT